MSRASPLLLPHPSDASDALMSPSPSLAHSYTPKADSSGHIESLIVKNFKSYAGVTEIYPFLRFTSIVGPNGSGKSNLMDAASFVLGVESRQLRGTNLKDLIYRKENEENDPQSHGRSAKVTLVLRAKDGTRVNFAREIKPQGQSSFFIDDHNVTAEAYNVRLSQYNIIVKARNFLVFQGDIEDVAQRGPSDLMTLFEQISGSGELRQEYERLEQNLREADVDVKNFTNRKRQLDVQESCLKDQLKEVEEFEEIQAEAKRLEVEKYVYRLYLNEAAAGVAQNEQMAVETSMVECEENNRKTTSELRTLDAEREKIRQEEQTMKRKIEDNKKKLENAKKASTQQKETLNFYQDELSKVEKRRERFYLAQERSKEKQQQIEDQIAEEETTIAEAKAAVAEISNPVDKLPQGLRKQYEEAKKSTVGIHAEEDVLVSEEQDLRGQLSESEKEKKMLVEQLENSKKEETKVTDILTHSENECKRLQSDVTHLQEMLATEENEITIRRQKRAEIQQERLELERERETYETSRYDNDRMVKIRELVRDMKGEIGGVYGLLSDLCQPTHRKYNVAITSALGKFNDHIVVKTFQEGKRCIQFLRRRGGQIMDFIPLDNIRAEPVDTRLRQLGGTACRALDTINYAEDLKIAFQLALKDTVIVDSLEEARQVAYHDARRHNLSVKVVTISGERILKNGNICFDTTTHSCRGGGPRGGGRAANNVYDVRNLEKIQQRLRDIETLEDECGTQPNLSFHQEDLQTKMHLAESRNSIFITHQRRLGVIKYDVEHYEKRIAALNKNEAALNKKLNQARQKLSKAREKRHARERDLFVEVSTAAGVEDLRRAEENYLERAKEAADREEQAIRRLKDLQLDLEKIQMEVGEDPQHEQDQIKEFQKEKAKASKDLSKQEETIGKLEASYIEYTGKLQSLEGSRTTYDEALKRKKIDLDKEKIELNRRMNKLERYRTELNDLTNEAEEILKDCYIKGISLPLKQGSMETIKSLVDQTQRDEDASDLELDYDILPDDVKELTGESKEEQRRREVTYSAKIGELLKSVEAKNPNFKAKEQHQLLQKDVEKFNQDKKDATNKRRIAEREYNKIKDKRMKLLKTCFEHVQESIETIYNDLTQRHDDPEDARDSEGFDTGGHASLELIVDAHSYFNSVIDYTVQPHAKRFKEMHLLSGGEKTLAALALLFAFQSFRPSPFLILDEVDAALDPPNVASLAKFLKSAKYQTIVISLKDRLYSEAECLLGVYKDMEEECSHILTLRLKDFLAPVRPSRMTASRSRISSTTSHSTTLASVLR